ncbi:MAG: 2-C-methyl-D-erythritol 4-phosphate cytidylyltransferase [Atribacterota bacterium]
MRLLGSLFFAVVVAAGVGERMNTSLPKQYLPLLGKPVLAYTLEAFERCEAITEVTVVIHPLHEEIFRREILKKYDFRKLRHYVFGGATRQDSVYEGIKLYRDCLEDFVLIHDGVRPLISEGIIKRCVEEVAQFEAVCVAIPSVDTLKLSPDGKTIEGTLDRRKVWRAQTPQAFRVSLILEALERAQKEGFCGTDDASLVERLGFPVRIVLGSEENLKITTPQDFLIAEEMLRWRIRWSR